MRQRSRRLADDSSGNTKLRRAREQRILKGEARDEAESWREKKPEGERRCQKRKFPGGGGGDRERQGFERGRETWPVRRELPCGEAPDGYQSIPLNQSSHLPLHHGKSFLLLSHPARKVVHLAPANLLPRIDESSEHPWAPRTTASTKTGKARLLYTKGLNAGLLWPRSRVFVIIASTFAHAHLRCTNTQRYLGTPDCYHLDTLFETCLFPPPCLSHNSVSESVSFRLHAQGGNVEPSF